MTNRKSHPMVSEWVAVTYHADGRSTVASFRDVQHGFGLAAGHDLVNAGHSVDTSRLELLLPSAVAKARDWVMKKRDAFNADLEKPLKGQVQALEQLRERREDDIRHRRRREDTATPPAIADWRETRALRETKQIFDEYLAWVRDTMTTEPDPYIRVVCVLTGSG